MPQAEGSATTRVYLEVGKKRVFACALDWPGWCRSGKGEERALETLAAYAERYAPVAREAGAPFGAVERGDFEVVERLPGTGGTDFGVPGEVASSDRGPVTAEEAERTTALLLAAWTFLDRVAAAAPAQLRKGPRGGGRDRDQMLDHVLGSETSYARMLGVRHPQPPRDDARAIAALRGDIVAALGVPSDGFPVGAKGWPPRYAARRIAWHVLDHAWEMEDKSERG
jgi:multidrug efflux pump subunit AcrA (membrane-fusion protein)